MKLIPEDIRPVYPEDVPAEKVRDKLLELLGLEPLPSSVQVEKGPAVESDDGLMEMPLTFQNGLGETVPGILLFPAESLAGTMGGIVCVSGTGGSAERVTHPRFHRPDPEGPALFGWGRELSRRGFVTLSISAKGTVSRRDSEHSWELERKLLAPYGRSQMGVLVEETLLAAKVLLALEEVDVHGVGLTGFSLGGNASWYSMACAPWIRTAASLCGGLGSLAQGIHLLDVARHSSYWYVPHMLRYFDHPEIVAACIAPRPFMMISPTRDERGESPGLPGRFDGEERPSCTPSPVRPAWVVSLTSLRCPVPAAPGSGIQGCLRRRWRGAP